MPERDDFSSNRHLALSFCLSMIFSENQYPLFRIMLRACARLSLVCLGSDSRRNFATQRNDAVCHQPTTRLSMRMKLGRSHNSMRSPRVSTFEKAGTPSRSAKVIGTVWTRTRLMCMTEVSGLPNPVAGCRRLARDADVAAQRFWYWPREKATALWTNERGA